MQRISIYLFTLLVVFSYRAQISAQSVLEPMDIFDLKYISDPQISPDGKTIVYVRRGMDIMTDRRIGRLWIINADGTNHQKLTNHERSEGNARWSPDGKRIVFTASTKEGSEIHIYWLKTGKVAKVSQLPASPRGLRWSPDGKHIAFSMFVKGSELALVKPPKKPRGAKWAPPPRITSRLKHEADGAGYTQPGFSHLFVLPAEGGTARQITSGNFHRFVIPSIPDCTIIFLWKIPF